MKSTEEIRAGWESIESKFPGGKIPGLDETLSELRGSIDPRALDLIDSLHQTVHAYHSDMGELLRRWTRLDSILRSPRLKGMSEDERLKAISRHTESSMNLVQHEIDPHILELVEKRLGGKLYQDRKTGKIFLAYHRVRSSMTDKLKGDHLFSGFWGGQLIEATSDILAGEEFVRYTNLQTGEGFACSAKLFDDGRFIPLILVPQEVKNENCSE